MVLRGNWVMMVYSPLALQHLPVMGMHANSLDIALNLKGSARLAVLDDRVLFP